MGPPVAASTLVKVGAALRKLALGYPQVREDFPWGERALKVKKKVFVFMHYDAGHLSLSVKLPVSQGAALMLSFAEPTGYGLGKAGWVTARFARGSRPPLRLLSAWVHESYQAVAPTTLVESLAAGAPSARARRVRRRKGNA